MSTAPDQISEDDVAGMAWWNGMEDQDRKMWIDRRGGSPKDAWELLKASRLNGPTSI